MSQLAEKEVRLDDTYLTPPKTLKEKLMWVGPSIVLCSIAIGSGEAIITPIFAATYGLGLLWVPILSALTKLFITERLARYTFATGNTFVHGLYNLPGPKGWAVVISFVPWIFLGFFLAVGWPLGVGSAVYASLEYAGLAVNDVIVIKSVAFLVIVSAAYFCIWGQYGVVELVCKIMIATVVVCVGICGIMLFPPANVFFSNILPINVIRYPLAEIGNMTQAIGYAGGGVMAISSYSYWVKEKGYHLRANARPENFKPWSKIYATDLAVAYIIQPLCAVFIIICAGTILTSLGTVPTGTQIILTTAAMLGEPLGPWAHWVWLLGAAAILYSTTIAVFDGWSRALADAVKTLFPNKLAKYSMEQIWKFFVLYLALGGIIFAVIGVATPATFVGYGSIFEGVIFYPIFGTLAIVICLKLVPKEKRGSSALTVLGILSTLYFLYVAIGYFGVTFFGMTMGDITPAIQ